MRLRSKGLGRKELVMDFREYEVTRDGDDVLVTGTIKEPVTWDFEIRMSPDDVPGMLKVGINRHALKMGLRWAFRRKPKGGEPTGETEDPAAVERAARRAERAERVAAARAAGDQPAPRRREAPTAASPDASKAEPDTTTDTAEVAAAEPEAPAAAKPATPPAPRKAPSAPRPQLSEHERAARQAERRAAAEQRAAERLASRRGASVAAKAAETESTPKDAKQSASSADQNGATSGADSDSADQAGNRTIAREPVVIEEGSA